MRRLFKPLFWSLIFLLLLLAVDQLLVQVPPVHPAHAAAVRFYRDFRSRLIGLADAPVPALAPVPPVKPALPASAPPSIEAVIDQQQAAPRAPAPGSAPSAGSQRYVYSDDQGQLQFVDKLTDVPAKYRDQAQPMGE